MIYTPIGLLHTNKKYWGDDAEEFRPERWEKHTSLEEFDVDNGSTGQGRRPMTYIPFSVGRRGCLGQHFAMLELKILLAYLIRDLQFSEVEGEKIRPRWVVTLRVHPRLRLNVESVPTSTCHAAQEIERFVNSFEA